MGIINKEEFNKLAVKVGTFDIICALIMAPLYTIGIYEILRRRRNRHREEFIREVTSDKE